MAADWLRPLIPATRDQLLAAFVRAWRERVSNPSRVIDADCPLFKALRPEDERDFDLADLELLFLPYCGAAGARAMISWAGRLVRDGGEPTFGDLASWATSFARTVDTSPLQVLGRSCDSAAVFLALRTVANEHAGKLVTPSDSIREVFGRRGARRFLQHCDARFLDFRPRRGGLARLRDIAEALCVLCGLIAFAGLCISQVNSGVFFAISAAAFIAAWAGSMLDDGLPVRVRTFRDLATVRRAVLNA